jgi:hypothetical protein
MLRLLPGGTDGTNRSNHRLAALRRRILAARDSAPMFDEVSYKMQLVRLARLAFDARVARSPGPGGHRNSGGDMGRERLPHVISSAGGEVGR